MTITVVQQVTATNFTASFASPTTAGNCLVVGFTDQNGAANLSGVTIGSSADNWANLITQDSATSMAALWADPSCIGGQTTITVSAFGITDPTINIFELAGVATSSPLETANAGSGNSTAWNSGSITTATAGDILLGVYSNGNNAAIVSGPGSPWNNTSAFDSFGDKNLYGYQILTGTGTFAYSGNASFPTSPWAAAIAALKPAAGGGGSPVNVNLPVASITIQVRPLVPRISVPLPVAQETVRANVLTPVVGTAVAIPTASVTARAFPLTPAITTGPPPAGPFAGVKARIQRLPYRRRHRVIFLPGWGQGNQGTQFPLFTRQKGYSPKWAPKIRRGAQFLPVPPQGNQGVKFPLFTRQYKGVLPRWNPKLRRGAFFMPGWGQAGNDPAATALFRQPGVRPRWQPPRRLVAGRLFQPVPPQANQGTRFPLFTRMPVRSSVRGLTARLGRSRFMGLPYVPQSRTAAASWLGAGHWTASAFLGRNAAAHWQGAGSWLASGVRERFGDASWSGAGSMTIRPVNVPQGHLSLTGAGSMSLSGSPSRVAALSMQGAGSMTAGGTGNPSLIMRGAGSLVISPAVTKQAALTLSGNGQMIIGAESGPPDRLILIPTSEVIPPARVLATGAWEHLGPADEPSEVTVTEIDDGMFDQSAE